MSHCIIGPREIDLDQMGITVIEDYHQVSEGSIIEEGRNVNWARAI